MHRVAEAVHRQGWEPGEDAVTDARPRRAHEGDPLGEESTGDEEDDLRGGVVEPLRIVDDTQERLPVVRDLGKQRQRGQPNQETVGRLARQQAKDCPERITLRGRQLIGVIQHRRAELVQSAVRELHLRLHPDRGRDPPACGALGDEVQQCALAGTCVAAKHDNSAPTSERVGQRSVKKLALGTPSKQLQPSPPPQSLR